MRMTLVVLALLAVPMAAAQEVDKWGDHIAKIKPGEYVAEYTGNGFPAAWYPVRADGLVMNEQLRDMPMTATIVHHVRRYVDDKPLDETETAKTMRDALGRVRMVRMMPSQTAKGRLAMLNQITVLDPMGRCVFRWQEGEGAAKEATVDCLSRDAALKPMLKWDCPMDDEVTEVAAKDTHLEVKLTGEKKMIEGFEAEAATDTLVMTGAGNRARRDKGVRWLVPELKDIILTTAPDGTPRWELTEIGRTAPDAALFYPPSGYRIYTAAQMAERLHLRESRKPQ